MSMPGNVFSEIPVVTDFLPPDDRIRSSLLVDFELAGIAIGDPSQGLQVQVWECRLTDEGIIQTKPEEVDDEEAWADVTTDTDITELSLSFDQNMRPTVAYVAATVAKLYWYDSFIAAYATSLFPGAVSPVVLMDDKRAMELGLNDILLFYLREGRIYHRRQRDRFTIEYDLAEAPPGGTRIRRAGMATGNRVQVEVI